MAEAEDAKKPQEQQDSKTESSNKKTSKGSILQWIIIAVIVAFCAGAGFGLGRLFAGFGTAKTAASTQLAAGQATQPENLKSDAPELTAADAQKDWYYDLEPVVANLNEPGVTRYIRIALTLQISPDMDKKKGTEFIDEKKPLLTNWLTIYLAGLSIEDTRGDRNLKRIQSQILDAFNEKLFPNAKPQIGHVLFKEFAIQ